MLTMAESSDGTIYRLGDRLVSTKFSTEISMCPTGTEVDIAVITREKSGTSMHIGIRSRSPLLGWHDLDGSVPSSCGLWVTLGTLSKCFEKVSNNYRICRDFVFRKRNLKGMKLRILSRTQDGLLLVEMEENVGGGGHR